MLKLLSGNLAIVLLFSILCAVSGKVNIVNAAYGDLCQYQGFTGGHDFLGTPNNTDGATNPNCQYNYFYREDANGTCVAPPLTSFPVQQHGCCQPGQVAINAVDNGTAPSCGPAPATVTPTPTTALTPCSGTVLGGGTLSCQLPGYVGQSCGTGGSYIYPLGGTYGPCPGLQTCLVCAQSGTPNNPTPSDTPTPTTSSPPPGGGGPPPGGGGPPPVVVPPSSAPPPVVVPPTATPVIPTATPTPPFDQSMCSCDGLNFSSIIAGQPLSVTAYGKVLSANTQYATIPSFDFIFYQGSGTQATIVTKATEKADIFATLPDKVRFKSDWTLNVPANLDPTLTYRIQAKPTCVRKVAAVSNIEENRVVLGASTDNSLWGKIMSFFADLFGGGEKTLPATQTNNFAANYSAVTPTEAVKKQNLQLDTFHPANILDSDNCSFIKFGF